MMSKSIKILVNGVAGAGKTSLLKDMGEDTFVISRDAKKFPYKVPNMIVDRYYNMDILLYGGEVTNDEGEKEYVEGVNDKLAKYVERYGKPPAKVAWDSVSQIALDVIESASSIPTAWGEQGAFITNEMAKLTSYIHETLELNGVNVLLFNHVIEEKAEGKPTGTYTQFGQGKFLGKGGFYATVNEAITIVPEAGHNRAVYTKDIRKVARSSYSEVPEKMYIKNIIAPEKSKKLKEGESYFNLNEYVDFLISKQEDAEEFSF